LSTDFERRKERMEPYVLAALGTIAFAATDCREPGTDRRPAEPTAARSHEAAASPVRVERIASGPDAGLVSTSSSTDTSLPLVKRTKKLVRHANVAHPSGIVKGCTDDVSYPEIAGALDAGLRAKLNRKLWPIPFPIDPVCDSPYEFELSYHVRINTSGLLSVVYDTASCCGAHPSFGKTFVNLAVPEGDELKLGRLLVPSAAARLGVLLRPLVKQRFLEGDFEPDIDEILDQLTRDPAEFSISPQGLEFSAFNSQAHVVKALYEKPFVVPFEKLSPCFGHRARSSR
jgi:hypothetical protein